MTQLSVYFWCLENEKFREIGGLLKNSCQFFFSNYSTCCCCRLLEGPITLFILVTNQVNKDEYKALAMASLASRAWSIFRGKLILSFFLTSAILNVKAFLIVETEHCKRWAAHLISTSEPISTPS